MGDPADFCKDGDAEAFKRRRAVEIKHGRISMYACIGYIAPEYFRWPGELSPSEGIKFTDVPNGLGAFSKVPFLGWLQILAFCGALETTGWTFKKAQNIGFGRDYSVNGEPGNYGLGFIGAFNTLKKDPSQRVRKLNAELANGRLASPFWGCSSRTARSAPQGRTCGGSSPCRSTPALWVTSCPGTSDARTMNGHRPAQFFFFV